MLDRNVSANDEAARWLDDIFYLTCWDDLEAEPSSQYPFPVVYNPYQSARSGRLPEYPRRECEQYTGAYLDGEFRAPTVDRALCRLLIEQEFFAFLSTQLSPDAPASAPLRQMGSIAAWFLGALTTAILLVICYVMIWAAHKWLGLPEGWAFGIGATITALSLFSVALGLVFLPFTFIRQQKLRKERRTLLTAQNDARIAVLGSDPVSVQRVRTVVERSADMGTVWPQSLFALLDDIAIRSARF